MPGKPRADGGEEVHAVVVPTDSREAAQAAVPRANLRLGPHQQISGMSVWPGTSLPRTPSLKIKRNEVLAIIQQPVLEAPAVDTNASGSLSAQVLKLVARQLA